MFDLLENSGHTQSMRGLIEVHETSEMSGSSFSSLIFFLSLISQNVESAKQKREITKRIKIINGENGE